MMLSLSRTEADDDTAIEKASISHGVLRANQRLDPGEIIQEYHLLRNTIFDSIRADRLNNTAEDK